MSHNFKVGIGLAASFAFIVAITFFAVVTTRPQSAALAKDAKPATETQHDGETPVSEAGDEAPSVVAAGKNRLALESSPYLLMHADNPVDWYPWGEEAFEKARRENKPIFLSVGYSTCYWCHVMERESFDNAETAKLLNEQFVSIKVDREDWIATSNRRGRCRSRLLATRSTGFFCSSKSRGHSP